MRIDPQLVRSLFISDLHLSAGDPITTARFERFMAEAAPGAQELYVLGDLFHVWLGDRMLFEDDFAKQVAQLFKTLSQSGTQIFIARGNRDFMLGDKFAEACGASLIPAEQVIQLGETRTLLLHGDELCTDDKSYQRLRSVLRSDAFYWLANHLPMSIRRAIAKRILAASRAHKAHTQMHIMDVNQNAVNAAFERNHVTQMIHGHTHQPARHQMGASGPLGQTLRWVLSDWQQNYGYLESLDGNILVKAWP